MIIKILGTGCSSCHQLEDNVKKVVSELDLGDVQIEHVTEMEKIIGYGVMSTPAVVVDEEVKGAGKVFDVEEIKKMLA